ncbi:MAG: glutathione S-transferase C-terminal domain-containing protein [Acidimicrobiales bacterium]|nr:glutathione S-transferase C-terminal domain-containing protein [Acidimicrobiales bacterium]MDG1876184.1 glutathione S-transferase C-terminal domain-containing protein [Acidimicrobiales bacterium]
MSTQPELVIRGAHSSPYSRKMRAVLRYRHIPHQWVVRGMKGDDMPDGAVPVIPVIGWCNDDGSYRDVMVDSSPQITKLEAEYAGRSIVPVDPATALLDFVLEDFADEWVSKAMYHYRWANEEDTEKSGRLLPLDASLRLPDDRAAAAHDFIIQRQVARRALVGSTDANANAIERSYERTLDALQAHLADQTFLFGDRPGRADFAMFGQLTPLVWWDPTPTAVAVDRAPRAIMWVQWLDDLSWWAVEDEEGGWLDIEDVVATTRTLFEEAGRTYAPFMIANHEAIAAGADEVFCEMEGAAFRQAPFSYQGKCLDWIRAEYAALTDTDRRRVATFLDGTGCELLVS